VSGTDRASTKADVGPKVVLDIAWKGASAAVAPFRRLAARGSETATKIVVAIGASWGALLWAIAQQRASRIFD